MLTILASRPGGPLTAADNAAISREVALLKAVPGVKAVHEVGISPDGKAAEIEVLAGGRLAGGGGSAAKPLVDNLRAAWPCTRPA